MVVFLIKRNKGTKAGIYFSFSKTANPNNISTEAHISYFIFHISYFILNYYSLFLIYLDNLFLIPYLFVIEQTNKRERGTIGL